MIGRVWRYLAQGARGRSAPRGPARAAPQDAERARTACREALACIERGKLEDAEALLREAIALEHDLAEAHFQLGGIHERRGELEDAADCYELAVHFAPHHTAARFALAALRRREGRHAEAAAHYRSVLEHDPEDAAAHCNLCLALYDLDDYGQARVHGERAVALAPRMAEAHHNLALVLRMSGEPERALEHLRRALALRPHAAIASGVGHALRDLGRVDEAIAAYDRALALAPEFGDAVINRAYALLLKGDFRHGWEEYEKRFRATGMKAHDFGLPQWRGEPLAGRAILVHAEQALGDEIMFASCLPDLVAAAERVVIDCSARLAPLFCRSFPAAIVHGGAKEDPPNWLAALGRIDFQIPIGGLPRHFRPNRSSFPGPQGYLRADPARVRAWRARIAAGARLAIGLSWRGGSPKTGAHLRSIPLELFSPLLGQPHLFISLQHGASEAEFTGKAAAIRRFPGATEDFEDLAALICALDLVLSVDNTNVHLAGALGRPVWVLLSASPEWRYGLEGDSMPWYPSARLFRQGGDRRWEPVIERVAAALRAPAAASES